MKSILLVVSALLFAAMFVSCVDDKSDSGLNVGTPTEVTPYVTKAGTVHGKSTQTALSTGDEFDAPLRIVLRGNGTAEIAVGVPRGGGVMSQIIFVAQELKWTFSDGHIYFEDKAKVRVADLEFNSTHEPYQEFSGQKLKVRELFEDFTAVP